MYRYDLDPAVGADNMRFLAGIPNEERRTVAEASLKAGKSPDTVKIAARRPPPEQEPRERLEREKLRLERTIEALSKRLKEVESALAPEGALPDKSGSPAVSYEFFSERSYFY
jgi:hypothetical protein